MALADQRRRKARELVLEKAKRRAADATQRISAIKQASMQSDMACEHLRNVLDQREEVLKQVTASPSLITLPSNLHYTTSH